MQIFDLYGNAVETHDLGKLPNPLRQVMSDIVKGRATLLLIAFKSEPGYLTVMRAAGIYADRYDRSVRVQKTPKAGWIYAPRPMTAEEKLRFRHYMHDYLGARN